MVMTVRRKLSHLLAVWAVRVDPDPPLTFTTRRVSVDIAGSYDALASALGDAVARNKFTPPTGTEHRY